MYIQALIFICILLMLCIAPNLKSKTSMTICMDYRTDKHSAKGLRTDAQRMTANIPAGGVENFFLVVRKIDHWPIYFGFWC